MIVKISTAALVIPFVLASMAYAAHPLITDDTGTQGKGEAQLEFTGEYNHVEQDGVTTNSLVVPTIPFFSYGINDSSDIVFGVSYQHIRTSGPLGTTAVNGISDTSIELKWRFSEKNNLSFALKPGITLPTGNDDKGLGAGKTTYQLFFITTKELKPWAFHMNLGFIRNDNKIDERTDLWHASLAGVVDILKSLKAVVDIGMERARDKASDVNPGFMVGGIIYSISDQMDFDIGFKKGINNHGTDYSIPAGITWRF